MGIQDNALSAGCRDIRIACPHVSPDILDTAYRSGTLHVATAAPKNDYATRITLEPDVAEEGEYLGVLLECVGNRVYQHDALVRSAT
eukprot:6651090-Pyramimonas_sp.AAC.1